MLDKPQTFTCSLSIAGLGVRLNCQDEGVVADLQHRYREFPLTGEPDLRIEVRLTGRERPSPNLDTGTVFKDGILHFTAPGYEGQIRESEGVGRLSISSAYPVEEIDYGLRVAYALLAFQAGGLMLHAAGIVREGKAYLFFGHSGSGKTTVSRLSVDDIVLNDDLVLLMSEGDGWQVYGTPFWNPSQVKPSNRHAPLAGLYRLVQAPEVCLREIEKSEAVAELISNVPVVSADLWRGPETLSRLRQLAGAFPVCKLYFLPDDSFWDVIRLDFQQIASPKSVGSR